MLPLVRLNILLSAVMSGGGVSKKRRFLSPNRISELVWDSGSEDARQRTAQHLTATHATVSELTKKIQGRGHKLYIEDSPTYLMTWP